MEIATTEQSLDNTTTIAQSPQSFRLKGSLFTLTIMQLLNLDKERLPAQLKRMHEQTPKFFHHTPVVLDLKLIPKGANIDFAWTIRTLREFSLIPVGVRSGTLEQQQTASAAGLALLPEGKETDTTATTARSHNSKKDTSPVLNKLITKQVRSGQQIYAPDGDLIVLGSVSTGAELLADGNIHVYGPLRGRALAGVNGNTQARIFCKSLECELVSIAGHYMLIEEQKAPPTNTFMQVYLNNNDVLVIETL